YRLEVDVSDNTAQAVVVMFNETATALVNCYADSLMDTVDETSRTSVDLSQPRAGTLKNLLMWARNRNNDVYCFLPNLFWIYHSSITPHLQRMSLQSFANSS
nr:hypothetical protein [Tanacetum cinerariifolium]